MGWSISLISDKKINEQEIDDIVKTLPKDLHHFLLNSKQSWGWSCATDISLPVENVIKISGAYGISGHKAGDMKSYLIKELKKNGHKIKAGRLQ